MRYPNFLKKNCTIGVCAPSAGVGHKLKSFDESLKVLKNEGFRVVETNSVRNIGVRSANAKVRANELKLLVNDEKIDMIITATGGDYMFEIMPYVDFDNIEKNIKWYMGYSDPTNLLYTITTKLDIATLYGFNAGSYSLDLPLWQKNNLKILKGDLIKQKSYKKYISFIDSCNGKTKLDKEVKWISNTEKIDVSARLIGGCFEVIEKLIGTKYDYTLDFINRYKDDGIIWFFDVFSDSSYTFYLTLLQMKYAGYFENTKAVIFGRVAFEKIEDKKLDYFKAAKKVLKNIPFIMDADIGHSDPKMTLINGSIARIKYCDNKGEISFKLK